MGRVKLQIKKLELSNNKQVTYSKRRVGLQKKAQEMAVLCDIDILLVLFSPSGKLSWCAGNSSAEQVIIRFASLSPQERAKRKAEVLEHLKRLLKKSDHELNLDDFLQQRSNQRSSEELHQHLQMLRQQLSHTQQRLSMHNNFETIEEGEEVERRLKDKLMGLRSAKEEMLRWRCQQQLIPFGQMSRATMFPVQKGMQMNSGHPNANILQLQSWTMDEAANNIPSCSNSRGVNGPCVTTNGSHDEVRHGYEELYRHRLMSESNLTLQESTSEDQKRDSAEYMSMHPSSSTSGGHPAMPLHYWHPTSNLNPASHAGHNQQAAFEEMNEGKAGTQIRANPTHWQQYLERIRSENSSRERQNANDIGGTTRWRNNFTPLSVSLSHLQDNDSHNHNHNHNHSHGL